MSADNPSHIWMSNAAFRALTGIKQVCLICGAPSNNAPKVCPGKRPKEPTDD